MFWLGHGIDSWGLMFARFLILVSLLLSSGIFASPDVVVEFSPPMVNDRPLHYGSSVLSLHSNRSAANNFCILKGYASAESYEPVGYSRGTGYTGDAIVIREDEGDLIPSEKSFLKTELFARIACKKFDTTK